ncbi:MAG: DsbA family protein [Rubellimicrobium sp.]|nr:DsbA family protein [Rubellimicrobium sp.]
MRLFSALATALAIGTAGLGLPARAEVIMTDAEREAFRAEVRAYLLEHPEVLMEAIGVLEEREMASRADVDRQLARANAEALFDDGHSWVGGNPEGDVTIVEFIDYRCGFCRQAFPEVESLLEIDGNIRLIIKEFPILGEQSVLASQFAISVLQLHGDDAYKQVHDALMALRSDITPESLSRLAQTFELEPAPLLARMGSPEVAQVIEANRRLAQAMNISGTPTFVVEDQMVRGFLPMPQMLLLVEDLRGS